MNNTDFTRRGLLLGGIAMMAAGCTSTTILPEPLPYALPAKPALDPQYARQTVAYPTTEEPGTIVVNTAERFLYRVEEGGQATRYGVGVPEMGLSLMGTSTIQRKAEWPKWTPTDSMMMRKPRLAEYKGGVQGGPENPLGARALYLYRGGQDTMFRLHGTNEPFSIGQAVSNGCIRMLNEDIMDLYERTPVGTKVLII